MNKAVSEKVKRWLATQFDTNSDVVNEMLENQLATTYLLIWPIMEKELFEGFMKKEKIEEAAELYEKYYLKMNVNSLAKYFHDRYQDSELYRRLKHNDEHTEKYDAIIKKRYTELGAKEKLMLMFFVVYRYRNNIFHGSKGIQSWLQYSAQIEKCLEFMMMIVDCNNKYAKNSDGDKRL